MATAEQKTELVETLKGPRFYRVVINGYGGESAYINISKEAYEFWNTDLEENGDTDFINYLVTDDPDEYEFDNITDIPPEVDFLMNEDDDYKSQWYEAPTEFMHQYGVEYSSAYMTVDEVAGTDYSAKDIATVIENEDVSGLIDKVGEESDYELELADFGEAESHGTSKQGDYVAQMFSSEKGTFFDGTIETTGDFDVKKLKIQINEYPNGEDIIDGVTYDGEEVDNEGGDTNGKGYSAHVWSNINTA